MHLNYFIVIFGLLAIAKSGLALQCYICAGSKSSDCGKGIQSSMVVRDCHHPRSFFHAIGLSDMSDFQVVCLTATLTNFEPSLFERNCGIFPPQVDPCTALKKKIHLSDCKSCTTDKCNARMSDEDDISVSFGKL